MNDTLAHLRDVLKGQVALGASREVGRIFLACTICKATVPQWHLVQKVGERERIGCKCGNAEIRPTHIPELYAAAWLIYGYVVRKLIQRKSTWDPRLPWQR